MEGSFYIGGVSDISLLLDHPHRVSSAGLSGGCIRHLVVDSVDLGQGALVDPVREEGTGECKRSVGGVCGPQTCKGQEQGENEVEEGAEAECRDEWDAAWCECPAGTAGNSCELGEFIRYAIH